MKIIAHRGYWEEKSQQNTLDAIALGLTLCDGVEIDLRTKDGRIVLSHDPDGAGTGPDLEAALEMSQAFPDKIWALNLKEDGLGSALKSVLSNFPHLKYFCFDMSFPETVQFLRLGLRVASRVSDFEGENAWLSERAGAYILDGFERLPLLSLAFSRPTLVISPELHGRPFDPQEIRDRFGGDHFLLCTDRVWDFLR